MYQKCITLVKCMRRYCPSASLGVIIESMEETETLNNGAGGASILIVEDDEFLRSLITKKLTNEGLTMIEAIDGEDAMRKLQETKPQLILLDLVLPGMDGFEVLRRLHESPETKDIPVLILSNLGSQEDIDRGLELGAGSYMVKAHVTPDEIVAKVKSML